MAKTYDTYKDSGIAWIGEIPGEWEVCRLKDTSSLYTGNSIKDEKKDYYEDKNDARPYIATKDIDATYMTANYENGLYIKHADNNFRIAPPFSSLMCIEGGSAGRKKTFIDREVSFVNKLCCFAPLKGVLGKYIYYFLCSPNFEDIFNSKITGLIGGVNIPTLKNIECLLPPLSVQQSISSFLDTKCGEIDSLISIQEEMISELLAYKQSVITEAVTKGLDKKAKMKNSGVEWIGDIPEEWEVIKIQYLNQGLTDGTHGTYNRVDKGRLLLSSKNVREKDLLITDSESQISEEDYQSIISNGFPKKGDLLMCCIGASIGRCIIYKYDETYAFQRSVIFIRCNKLIKPELLRYNLLSNNSLLQELFLINQSAQAGLYQGQVKEIKVIVPPISKQEPIIDYLDEKTSQIDSLIALKQSKIESLKEYKKSIIYEYVTGKKRV